MFTARPAAEGVRPETACPARQHILVATLREQVRNNAVALISLVVALSSLAYNTWRNERTEANRNLRAAGFELIRETGSLQQVVFYAHFSPEDSRGDPRMGWADVLTIGDLAQIMPAEVASSAGRLQAAWRSDFSGLGESDAAHERIDRAIDELRATPLDALHALD